MLTNKRLILSHFWLAFIVFGAALVLGAWQMFVRSPLNVWHFNPEFYYRRSLRTARRWVMYSRP